jgi:multicomponent Na+:H+ antiporter subunit G
MNEVVDAIRDVISVALFSVGALLAVVASIGLHRLKDTLSRMHAATKPATFGVLCCGVAAAIQMGSTSDLIKVVVIIVLQLVTAPVGAHMLARSVANK